MAETSSGNFPDSVALQFSSLTVGRAEATDIEVAYSGREVRRSRFPIRGYRYYNITTAPLVQSDAELLRDFMIARRGRMQAFQFYPTSELYLAEPAGAALGVSSLIIPFTAGTYTVFYVNGSPTAFDVTPGVGPYGEDQVNFNDYSVVVDNLGNPVFDSYGNEVVVGPGTGAPLSVTGAVTFDGIARPRILARSDLDNWEHALLATDKNHTVWNLKFKEVI
jgi:hypothetical protein